ncbi:MAG: tetratricopeptide repeat protein, partial [Candidatus Dadabacteria bacterium]|nr:tetratricopeptide repeat protein [Candidatus Dadabacteria bacterium]
NAKKNLGDHRGAIQDYNKAIQLNPNYALAYYNRGIVKIHLGQKDSGCLDLSKAGEMGFFQAYDAIKQYCN